MGASSFDGNTRAPQWAPPPPPTPPPTAATRIGGGAYEGLFSGLLPPSAASLGGGAPRGPPHRASPPQRSSLSAISSAPLVDAPSLEEEMAAAERALQGLTDAFRSQPQPPTPREERTQPSPAAARRLMAPPPSRATPIRASARSQPVRGTAPSPAPSVRVNRHGSIMIGASSRGGSRGAAAEISSHRQHASPLVALGF